MALLLGNNSNNTINGTGNGDLIFALDGNDTINSGGGSDWVFAGSGNDSVNGGDGNDFLFGDSGNDTLNGGRGGDLVDGGSGSDSLIFNAADGGGFDAYNGGSGVDRIIFELTTAQWANAAIKADVLALLTRIGAGNTSSFTLRSLNLSVANVEGFQVKVDGVVINPFGPIGIAPIAVNDTFSLTENGVLGTSSSVIGNDTTGTGGFTVSLVNGPALGLLALNANGTFTYNPGTAYDYLAAGVTANTAFTYRITNSVGVSNTATVNITVTGTNDVPVVTGEFAGEVFEDSLEGASTSGAIVVSDADAGQSGVVAGVQEGVYGTLELQANGNWTYVLDNARAATQGLSEGEVANESFVVTALDGTVLSPIEITVTGTNDAPTAEFYLDEGSPFAVFEDGVSTISGGVIINDADEGEAGVLNPGVYEGVYGALTVSETGAASYTLDQERSTTQALRAGQIVTETFELFTIDGTALTPLVLEVNGANDEAIIIENFGGLVGREDSEEIIFGTVIVEDTDLDESGVLTDTIVGAWGTFAIEANGEWIYARNGEPIGGFIGGDFIEQAFVQNDLLESFEVSTIDGTLFNVDIYVTGEFVAV